MNRIVFLGDIGFLFMECKENEVKKEIVRSVKVAKVESRSEVRKDYAGIVEAVDFVKLAFRVSGQIVELPIIEGQKVKKGDLIAKIDPREISLQYASDKAAYETAKAQIERNERLLNKQVISRQDYETSKANYERAKSAYDLSVNNMTDTRLVAPFDGSIEKRLVENFQRVTTGMGIVQLVNTNKLRIKFTIPDSYIHLLKSSKQTFNVEFDTYKGNVFDARIEEYLDISTNGAGIPVSIIIEDPNFDRNKFDVKPGFSCNISMKTDVSDNLNANFIEIPLSSVFEEAKSSNKYVWVVDNNRVIKREVKVDSPSGDTNIRLTGGLKAGETVVTAGVHQLRDGEIVKAINK